MKKIINIFGKEKQQTVHSVRRCLLIGLLAMLTLPSVSVYAETQMYEADGPTGTGTIAEGISNTDAAEGFIHRAFFHDEPAAAGASLNLGERLSGPERVLYTAMKKRYAAMTTRSNSGSGTAYSTVVRIPLSDLAEYYPKMQYTAQELGVASIIENSAISEKAWDAFMAKFKLDAGAAVDSLVADSPYDFYWFDKTRGYTYSFPGVSTDGKTMRFVSNGYYEIKLYVAKEYAVSRTAKTTDFDLSFTNAVCDAADTAAAIVRAHKDESDIAKLYSYKNEICSRVSYNNEAAGNSNTPFGNPWQAVWVFDGNSKTNVLCEGYSKAFRYLCDLSVFRTPIYTICVSGWMDGGSHMWNIVTMDDGKRYMADVTNCDDGSIGAPNDLFMAGYSAYRPGNPLSEYDFSVKGKKVTYRYDDSTVSLFRKNECKRVKI